MGGVYALKDYYGFYDPVSDTLIMLLCPAEQCCQHVQCAVYGMNECPSSRNASCPLCGKCNQGLSETLGSVNCRKCENTNWLLIMAFAALLTAVYVYLRYAASISTNMEPPVIQVVITKCVTYFYQTVPLLLPSHSVHSALDALLTVFTFEPSDGNGKGLCILPDLDAMGKLLLPLFAAAWLNLLAIVCIGACLWSKYGHSHRSGNINGLLSTELDERPELESTNQPLDKRTNALRTSKTTLWLVVLFQYSSVSQAALKLVACRTFGEQKLAYYAPVYECFSSYNGWEYGVFVLVASVCCFPVVVVYVAIRDGESNEPSKLTQSFRDDFQWYEGVLMFRRLILIGISFTVQVLVSNELRQGLLICGCISALYVQIQCQPFKDPRVNLCESTLLTLLVVIAALSFVVSNQEVRCVTLSGLLLQVVHYCAVL